MYVARHVLDVSVFQTLLGMGPPSSTRHYWITVSIWGFTMLLALSTDNLGSILEIFGAFGASVSPFLLVARRHLPKMVREWMGLFGLTSKKLRLSQGMQSVRSYDMSLVAAEAFCF